MQKQGDLTVGCLFFGGGSSFMRLIIEVVMMGGMVSAVERSLFSIRLRSRLPAVSFEFAQRFQIAVFAFVSIP